MLPFSLTYETSRGRYGITGRIRTMSLKVWTAQEKRRERVWGTRKVGGGGGGEEGLLYLAREKRKGIVIKAASK